MSAIIYMEFHMSKNLVDGLGVRFGTGQEGGNSSTVWNMSFRLTACNIGMQTIIIAF